MDRKSFRMRGRFLGQRFFAVEAAAALAWVDVTETDRFVRMGENAYRLIDSGSIAKYLIPDWMMFQDDWIVRLGDMVTIQAQGVMRSGVVTYVCKDGPYWIIELKNLAAPACQQCVYWKQRHDGGQIVSVEVANG